MTPWLKGALRHPLVLCACVLMAGCTTWPGTPAPPAARTTVILLPDADGQVGAVLVGSDAGTQRLDRAFTAATVGAVSMAPSSAQDLGRESVARTFGELLKAQPAPPSSFTLHFLLDKTVLTDASKALLPAVLAALPARTVANIVVFGHADASGTEDGNMKLSGERARYLAELLRKHDPTLDKIEIHALGDAMPLVPSATRAPDPRNRRVEILIF